MSLKATIRESKLGTLIWPALAKIKERKKSNLRRASVKALMSSVNPESRHIFYCGVCESSNMGDMAQTYCTLEWMKKNYPKHQVILCRSSVFMDERCRLTEAIRSVIREDDLIFFQSGYNTHDLGGYEDYMHQKVIKAFPDTEIIMLPQTVYFLSDERRRICSDVYNGHKNMLFLARDPVSEQSAREMFPELTVMLFPDIVTSLIGRSDLYSSGERNGVYLCRRKDVEQFYTEDDYIEFEKELSKIDSTTVADTIISASNKDIYNSLEKYVRDIVSYFSGFKLVVTDKFHGLVFSLVADTPVIVLKTKDHKVTSGYKWFSEIYKDRVFYAESPTEAGALAEKILTAPSYEKLDSYFNREYYQKLSGIIGDWEKDHGNL